MELAVDNRLGRALDRHGFEQIVTRCSDAVIVIDARGDVPPVIYVNPAFENLTGYAAHEVVGMPWRLLQRDCEDDAELDRLRQAVDRGEAVDVVLTDVCRDDTVCHCRISFSPLHDADGEVRYWLFLQNEIRSDASDLDSTGLIQLRRELARAHQKTDQTSRVDPVTGLLRYEYFIDVVNRDLAVARRDRRPVSILVFEVNELDVYRATFGDKAAESCMRMIAAQVSGALRRAGDLCSRRGVSTLAAFVLGQDESEAAAFAMRIVDNVLGLRLHNPRAQSGRHISINAAVRGGTPKPDEDAESLVAELAQALRAESGHRAPCLRLCREASVVA